MGSPKLIKDINLFTKKHSPKILTAIGITGMITTTVMAVKATPKAIMIVNEREVELKVEKLPPKEIVKATWKCYIPCAITGILSISCIIGANSINAKRSAAIATAYTLSETALREYKNKVIETIGEKKEKTIRDEIAKDKIERNPVTNNEIVITEKGNTLCYDVISGRYFKSDIDTIKKAVNELNRQLLNEGVLSLNDFYYEIGLDNIKIGYDLGWDIRQGLIDLDFSSQLSSDGTPCLVLDFLVAPVYNYYK